MIDKGTIKAKNKSKKRRVLGLPHKDENKVKDLDYSCPYLLPLTLGILTFSVSCTPVSSVLPLAASPPFGLLSSSSSSSSSSSYMQIGGYIGRVR